MIKRQDKLEFSFNVKYIASFSCLYSNLFCRLLKVSNSNCQALLSFCMSWPSLSNHEYSYHWKLKSGPKAFDKYIFATLWPTFKSSSLNIHISQRWGEKSSIFWCKDLQYFIMFCKCCNLLSVLFRKLKSKLGKTNNRVLRILKDLQQDIDTLYCRIIDCPNLRAKIEIVCRVESR